MFPIFVVAGNVSDVERIATQVSKAALKGISVRDYFAAAALMGLLSNPAIPIESLSSKAFGFADEMLATRDSGGR